MTIFDGFLTNNNATLINFESIYDNDPYLQKFTEDSSDKKEVVYKTTFEGTFLGFAVGNANEVAEALAILRGARDAGRDVELCIELAALMVSLAQELPLDAARQKCRAALADGRAYEKFAAMVRAQGGDLERFAALMDRPTFKFRIQAMKSGRVAAIDAEKVARVALSLGAGRLRTGDAIDPRAGVTLAVQVGDRVGTGSPLATLEKSTDPEGLEKAAAELYKAFEIATEAEAPASLILERID